MLRIEKVKTKRRWILGWLLATFFAWGAGAEAEVRVWIELPERTLSAGETIEVPVYVEDGDLSTSAIAFEWGIDATDHPILTRNGFRQQTGVFYETEERDSNLYEGQAQWSRTSLHHSGSIIRPWRRMASWSFNWHAAYGENTLEIPTLPDEDYDTYNYGVSIEFAQNYGKRRFLWSERDIRLHALTYGRIIRGDLERRIPAIDREAYGAEIGVTLLNRRSLMRFSLRFASEQQEL